jgi:hypothetical protein
MEKKKPRNLERDVKMRSTPITSKSLFVETQFTKKIVSAPVSRRRQALTMVAKEKADKETPQIRGINPGPGVVASPRPSLRDCWITKREIRKKKAPLT